MTGAEDEISDAELDAAKDWIARFPLLAGFTPGEVALIQRQWGNEPRKRRNEQRKYLAARLTFLDESIESLEAEVAAMKALLLRTTGPAPESLHAEIRQTEATISGLHAELGAAIERVDQIGLEDEEVEP